jgi:CRP-like cAMP-binding protein
METFEIEDQLDLGEAFIDASFSSAKKAAPSSPLLAAVKAAKSSRSGETSVPSCIPTISSNWASSLFPCHNAHVVPQSKPGKQSVAKARGTFDLGVYLESARGPERRVVQYQPREVVFSQGDPCDDIRYVQEGVIRLSVLSRSGKEAVLATLGPGDFFGEGTLAGQTIRIETATAEAASRVLVIEKATMVRLLHDESSFSDRFLSHMLARNIRIEADLVDQLFNSSEKRLARALLLLARYGQDQPPRTLQKVSQETLAEMIGTTRSRVNFFMNKFRKLGLIEYNGGLKVNASLLGVILHD